jgi:hypothetical protein
MWVKTLLASTTICQEANLAARQALKPIPELALEEIHDKAVVPHPVYRPFLFASDLLR